MLSYQHGYHAGNFADVVKHLTLCELLSYLTQKEKPLFYLETHSGKGIYDLKDSQANKTGEYKQGISILWQNKASLPPIFKNYLDTISASNSDNQLRYYPGSPLYAISNLRTTDRLLLSELHTQEFDALTKLSKQGKKVHFNHADGISSLKSALPPFEKRGLIFIDPAYEIKEEYRSIPKSLAQAYKLFPTGTYCLWYPIIDPFIHQQLIRRLTTISDKFLQVEFSFDQKPNFAMNGCGLWIINPPYILKENLNTALKYLKTIFNNGQARFLLNTGSL